MNKNVFIALVFTIVFTAIGVYFLPLIMRQTILLSREVYYELPSGGYIYVDNEYIRYNKNEFDGTLDYQITLNYTFVDNKGK